MYIGLDVGGTKILGIVFDGKKILKSKKIETEKEGRGFIDELSSLIKELSHGYRIKGIGVGLPGIMNRETGLVINMPNISHIKNINIKKKLQSKFKIPVKIEKDGNCMAIAESILGLGKGKKSIVCITLGTGLGGGVIIDKKLYIGRGSAAELGHINFNPDGYKCHCGNKGCLEEYVSGRAIMRLSREAGLRGSKPRDIEMLARHGNKKALEVHKKFGIYLGIGLSSIIKTLDPELIVLSGSLCKAADLFLLDARKEVEKRVFFQPCKIEISKLQEGPALGAACLFMIHRDCDK